ncbi:KTSC domain-containing protein [Kribbella solani]|uniref:KTSC domain-containing protein n=1 Tax=Kribbella solani TaxID=236067 RepID=UPI0029B0AB56|nr:KTSC domain-containing protein [Kribbella solani]MDX2974364.1 KTSC domain-containing protein [Kribbella solani]MDX3002154.1 KTSC domain-containing protein [Kribbella solani]
MRRRAVESSSVRSVGWSDGTLELEYVNGYVYQYLDVPQPTFAALMAASSIGAYVNEHIKPYYDFREI